MFRLAGMTEVERACNCSSRPNHLRLWPVLKHTAPMESEVTFRAFGWDLIPILILNLTNETPLAQAVPTLVFAVLYFSVLT